MTIFNDYAKHEADAIRQALIEQHMKPDADWPRLLAEITMVVSEKYPDTVLYEGVMQRGYDVVAVKLHDALQEYYRLPEPQQWHINRQAFDYLPSLDGETAPIVPSIIHALLDAVQQAKRRPFDHPYAVAQKRGAPKNWAIRLRVGSLLKIFERATGMEPTVYVDPYRLHDDDYDYAGTFCRFAIACLAPAFPAQELGSAILAAYKQKQQWADQEKYQERQWADQMQALTEASTPRDPLV